MSPDHDLTGVRRPGLAAVALTATAGYVDAFVFLRVTRVFIANQSGNLIVGGMSAVGGKVGDVVLPFVSVLAYIAGAATAAALFDRPERQGRRRLLDTVAAVVVALVGAAVALAVAGEGHAAGPRSPVVIGVVAATALSSVTSRSPVRTVAPSAAGAVRTTPGTRAETRASRPGSKSSRTGAMTSSASGRASASTVWMPTRSATAGRANRTVVPGRTADVSASLAGASRAP